MPPAVRSGAMTRTTDRGSNWPAASPSRSVSTTCSSCSPSRLATTTGGAPSPGASSSLPRASGGLAGAVSTATFGARRTSATASARGRPWAETTSASSQLSPAAAQARATDDGAGWIRTASRPSSVDQDPRHAEEARVARRQHADAPALGVPAAMTSMTSVERTDQLDLLARAAPVVGPTAGRACPTAGGPNQAR